MLTLINYTIYLLCNSAFKYCNDFGGFSFLLIFSIYLKLFFVKKKWILIITSITFWRLFNFVAGFFFIDDAVVFPQQIVLLIIVQIIVCIVLRSISRGPRHLIFLLQSSSGVSEPGGDLCQSHFGYDGQHDFLALCGVGIFPVFIQPGF